jgi:hypothetical protein
MRYWDGREWTAHTHSDGNASAPSANGGAPTAGVAPATPAAPTPEVALEPAPTPETTGVNEVALSEAQVAFLTSQLTLRGLVKRTLGWAITVPFIVGALGYGLIRLVGWIPLFGWIFALWGIVGTIAAVIAGIIVTPLVALVLLPIVMLVTRPKLREDLASGRAIRQAGRFVIEEQKVGPAQLRTGTGKSFDLTGSQVETLKDILPAVGDVRVLNGSLMKTTRTSLMLGLYDESGRELLSAGG